MTQTFAEILLFVPTALCTGFVLFVAGVIQGVMDDLDETGFKRFLLLLKTRALRSPYAIGVSSVTFVGLVPYFIYYGFGNRRFTAGLFLWVIFSIVSKATVLPIYARVEALPESDAAGLREERQNLRSMNILRAALSLASVVSWSLVLFKASRHEPAPAAAGGAPGRAGRRRARRLARRFCRHPRYAPSAL